MHACGALLPLLQRHFQGLPLGVVPSDKTACCPQQLSALLLSGLLHGTCLPPTGIEAGSLNPQSSQGRLIALPSELTSFSSSLCPGTSQEWTALWHRTLAVGSWGAWCLATECNGRLGDTQAQGEAALQSFQLGWEHLAWEMGLASSMCPLLGKLACHVERTQVPGQNGGHCWPRFDECCQQGAVCVWGCSHCHLIWDKVSLGLSSQAWVAGQQGAQGPAGLSHQITGLVPVHEVLRCHQETAWAVGRAGLATHTCPLSLQWGPGQVLPVLSPPGEGT